MSKLIATVCVVSWSGFWAFGYLALTASAADTADMVTSFVLAALAFFVGMFTYLKIARTTDPGRVRHAAQGDGV